MQLNLNNEGEQLVVEVALSRRNLLSLLHKLDMPGSLRTLETDGSVPVGWRLRVRAEDDAEHYQPRGWPPPGIMHPATEAFLAEREQDGADD